jgi:predicted lipid-binding transport protein (Tim44 family)
LADRRLAAGDAAAALAALQVRLDPFAAASMLDGTRNPHLIELACHRALAPADAPRADEWLGRAHTALMAQAEAVTDHSPDAALHQGFLQNVPWHRAIVAAWARRDVADAAPAKSED